MKKKLLVSFSGGETSGYMLYWIIKHKSFEFDITIVFANTGNENEETLNFVDQCAKEFGVKVVWVEANATWTLLYRGKKVKTDNFEQFKSMWDEENVQRNGFHCVPLMYNSPTEARVVDFNTASRNGEPFEKIIQRYGIPNVRNKVCTRELKDRVIKKYCRSIGWKASDYEIAVGFRVDELDRAFDSKGNKQPFYMPLTQEQPMTKPMVNFWWNQMPFRLMLKGYEGNCKDCFEKNMNKLLTIARESVDNFDFTVRIEDMYSDYIPYQHRYNEKYLKVRKGRKYHFFRGNISARQIIEDSKTKSFKKSSDDSDVYEWEGVTSENMYNGCSESCQPFTK